MLGKKLTGGCAGGRRWREPKEGTTLPAVCVPPPQEASGPFPPPGDLPNPGIEPRTPALQAESLSSEPIRKRNRAHFGRIQMDQWYQPKCTSLNNQSPHWGMWASIRSLFPIMITESKSVIFAKEKRKNILRVSSWDFPWDLAVGILSFHFHDQSSIPGQGTDPLHESLGPGK